MKALLIFVCAVVGTSAAARAQAVKQYDFHLDNGAEVIYQTFAPSDSTGPAPDLGGARALGNVIERTVMGPGNRQLGFDLNIARLPGDPIRFRISMGSLEKGGWGYFAQTPVPREIENGDRVLVNVMDSPGGGKIFDSFQVGIGVAMHAMPVAKTIPKTPAADATIHLQGPCSLDGATPLKSVGSVSGRVVDVSIPGEGVFEVKTSPGFGFRMEAIAEGDVLMFVVGSRQYNIQCGAGVVDGAGAWYLWVRPAPAEMLKRPLEFTTPR